MENFADIVSPEGGEEKDKAKEAIDKWRQEAKEFMKGERKKTEREIKYINTINELISRTLDALGVDIDKDEVIISLNQVHILDGGTFKDKFPHLEGAPGFYRSMDDAIYLDDSKKNPDASLREITKFDTLLHEALHSVSHQKFYVESKKIEDFRVGYRLGDVHNKGRNFEGFNEGVLSLTEIDIMRFFADELEDKFGFTEEQIEGPIYSYSENQELVLVLANEIARHRQEDILQSLERIMRGMFTGEMMHLRDIERIYGESSLQVLAKFGYEDQENNNLILEYFTESDAGKREEIKKRYFKTIKS